MAVHVQGVADVYSDIITHLSLHTANGGTTGANELAGGDYTREVPVYGAPAGGIADLASAVTFGGPAVASDALYVGFWVGAVWQGSALLSDGGKTGFVAPDTLTLSSAPVVVTAP